MIANPITLKKFFFEKDNMLNEVGGTEYLVKLTRFSGSTQTSDLTMLKSFMKCISDENWHRSFGSS